MTIAKPLLLIKHIPTLSLQFDASKVSSSWRRQYLKLFLSVYPEVSNIPTFQTD